MTMDEYKQFGGLPQKAREENHLGEVMVFADVERDVMEQLQRYQAPVIGPKTKPKAKVVRDYRQFATDASSSGAMSDASKRRLSEDLEVASMIEGVNSNDNLPAVPDEGWEQVYAPLMVQASAVGVPYQGDPVLCGD